jgi:hypothetical protein
MTTRRAIVAALLLLLVALVFWKMGRGVPNATGPDAPSSGASPATTGPGSPTDRRLPPPERSPLADALNSPATDIRADLRLVTGIIETFRSNFLQTGNPVGSNAEITAALTGRNKLRLALIPADHPAINREGELCDRWGTPFFFHAESAMRMEIRSAGPDKKMWSADDVTHSP